jgi:hypothetical protein
MDGSFQYVEALGEYLLPVLDPDAHLEAERAERARHNARLIKQGFTWFRKFDPTRGAIIAVHRVDKRRGLVEARGVRSDRQFTVALADLYPYRPAPIGRPSKVR